MREHGRPEEVIAAAVTAATAPILLMGAYGHSPLRALIVGSTTTAVVHSVKAPILLMR